MVVYYDKFEKSGSILISYNYEFSSWQKGLRNQTYIFDNLPRTSSTWRLPGAVIRLSRRSLHRQKVNYLVESIIEIAFSEYLKMFNLL